MSLRSSASNLLGRFATLASRTSEAVSATIVVAIVLMLVIPLPPWLLDLFIGTNICIALLMAVVSLQLTGPLGFSTFPAMTLFATLFRLSIEISATRLILLEGQGGQIIDTFGNFVVGGNLVVGLVVFLIITVVQFLVITKGAERVAEVAARFGLDGMPGKQMSIDAELRANGITMAEAKLRRTELERTSQFLGAMEGAMKFVKGDAIAGIIIVAVNLVGGLAIGVLQRGLPMSQAIRDYSVLSIGDGLIAQIPALLVGLTAAFLTTRIAPADKSRQSGLGAEVVSQLAAQPKALVIAAGAMMMFSLVPGMPMQAFLPMAALLAGSGVWRLRASRSNGAVAPVIPGHAALAGQSSEFLLVSPHALVLNPRHRTDPLVAGLVERLCAVRNELYLAYGLPVPLLELRFLDRQPIERFSIELYEVTTVTGKLRWNEWLWRGSPEYLTQAGTAFVQAQDDPFGPTRLWIDGGALERIPSDQAQLPMPFLEVAAADLRIALQRDASRFLGVTEAQKISAWLEATSPELAKELQRVVPLPRLTEVLQRLCKEGISMRNVRQIAEALNAWGQRERDPMLLAEYVRVELKRTICQRFAPQGVLHACLVTPGTEDALRGQLRQGAYGTYLEIDEGRRQEFLRQAGQFRTLGPSSDPDGYVLLTTLELRAAIRQLIEIQYPDLSVLSYPELTQDVRIQPIGHIDLEGLAAYDDPVLVAGTEDASAATQR
jgi:type III secretion protein V